MYMVKRTLSLCVMSLQIMIASAQTFNLFSSNVKTEYLSVVYDFLERYLYEIDSLQKHHEYVDQRLRDDKVLFIAGSPATARSITPDMMFGINKVDDKFYDVAWKDSVGNTVLEMAFPMQYELLLGKPKVEIEKEFKSTLSHHRSFIPLSYNLEDMSTLEDGCLMTNPISNYYVESLNTATYYSKEKDAPTFCKEDKWHSAANLLQGSIKDVENYTLYIEQNLYGFKTDKYTIPLIQWLAYCQDMKLTTYFAIEEEREDGLKALVIAQSQDLGFNHMLSLIIPDNFTEKRDCVIKGTLNAYIPTQNVKDLYQQYKEKPRKKI